MDKGVGVTIPLSLHNVLLKNGSQLNRRTRIRTDLMPHIQLNQYHTIHGQSHKQENKICAVLMQILLAWAGLGYVPGAPRLFTSDETHE